MPRVCDRVKKDCRKSFRQGLLPKRIQELRSVGVHRPLGCIFGERLDHSLSFSPRQTTSRDPRAYSAVNCKLDRGANKTTAPLIIAGKLVRRYKSAPLGMKRQPVSVVDQLHAGKISTVPRVPELPSQVSTCSMCTVRVPEHRLCQPLRN